MKKIIKTLSDIRDIIVKNNDFLQENPEITAGILSQLQKAIDDDADSWLKENDPSYSEDQYDDDDDDEYAIPVDEEGSEMFDTDIDDEDIDADDEDAEYISQAPKQYQDIESEEPTAEVNEPVTVSDKPQEEASVDLQTTPKKKTSSGYRDWEPQKQYSAEHQASIDEHMKNGYSHREAERLAGAYQGPHNIKDALSHQVKPSDMSPKMLAELKELTGEWLGNARRVSYDKASAEKNPIKYAKGKTLKAHEEAMGDYKTALKEYQNSDELKSMKMRDRHKAIQNWKKEYKEQNPDFHGKAASVATAHSTSSNEASQARKQLLDDRLHSIATAGLSDGDNQMNFQEAAQHVGGGKADEGYIASSIKDPAASFAQANPDYMQSKQFRDRLKGALPEDALNRLKHVDNAAKHQGIERQPKIKKPGDDNGEK